MVLKRVMKLGQEFLWFWNESKIHSEEAIVALSSSSATWKKNLNGRSCLSYQNDPKGLNFLPCRDRELFPMEQRQLWGQRKNRGCHAISVRSTEMIPLRNNSEFKMSGQSK